MTLAAQILADVSPVFVNTADFAQNIVHYPLGIRGNAVTLAAVVDTDDETYGFQSAQIDNMHGTRLFRYGQIEMPATVAVTCSERPMNRDAFLIDGDIWHAERILGRDAAMQRVLVCREEGASTKTPRLGRG